MNALSTPIAPQELNKARSRFLRGTLADSLADELTGAMAPDDDQIGKFHGFYQQDDRDVRADRRERLLEPEYSFMLRARLPGGVCTPAQWLTIDRIGRELAQGSVRLTTRQTFQYHGIPKGDLRSVIQGIHQVLLDSLGGCGDVNRNVMCNPNPDQSALHGEVYDWARRISEHLLPQTRAYHELWLDGECVAGGEEESEPMYGATYLPRKFKIAVAVPPHNDVDVYANDLGFIAIADRADPTRLLGFNVLAGGGMGTTHGDKTTFPRLADDLGFVTPDQVLAVAEAVLTTQRDFGNRGDRIHARLKYTVERMGLAAFRSEVEQRAGITFAPPHPVRFTDHGDRYGWVRGTEGRWHLTLHIENGRLRDLPGRALLTGLRAIAQIHQGDFRITPHQNLIVAGVPARQKKRIETLAREHGLLVDGLSPIRLGAMACVAFPTCPQAMAEAERYLPDLLTRVEALAAGHGLADQPIVIRMTGCPNGCARPFLAEIGLVGKGPRTYNLLLGGDGSGTRLNTLYRENIAEAEILDTLDGLFARYAQERTPQERFGDFVVRVGIVRRVENAASDFHD
ncbi:assimilatory sulfite reductase (NADPH) hemoprotein subunit [uncultured Thiodictyon sp.]|uniref:assimilatory sulfite reductase (NADPH) hemoprotein subunit n=1 Tax=uncultured Thiodictyon sp. TaxID=1846217 RepID=UPI0025F1DEAA|nr:assimilatory sulfite reductase (NADPH) hemoprotein subunit [uncultured Thiodictyon sp.]